MRRFWLTIGICAAAIAVNAQESKDTATVNRQINIEKEYTPEIKDVKRKNIEYKVEETESSSSTLEYSNYVLPVNPEPNATPLEAQKLTVAKLKNAKDGYAEIGMGFNLNWEAEAYYRILKSDVDKLDVNLRHIGTYWKTGKNAIDPKVDIRTGVGFDYLHDIGNEHQLRASLDYNNKYYSYYGKDSLNWEDLEKEGQFMSRHTLNAMFGARSIKSMKEWDYDTEMRFKMNNFQYVKINEFDIAAKGRAFRSFGIHQIEFGAGVEGICYSGEKEMLKKRNIDNNFYVDLGAAYNLNHKWVDLHAGFKFAFSCIHDRVFNAMPDIRANFHLHEMVRLGVYVTGDFKPGSLSHILDVNPYAIIKGLNKNEYKPVIAKISVTTTPVAGLTLTAGLKDEYVLSELMFSNQAIENGITRYFDSHMEQYNKIAPFFSGSYEYKERYRVFADFQYNHRVGSNHWSGVLWHEPEAELHVGTELQPIDDLFIGLNYYMGYGMVAPSEYTDGVVTGNVKMPTIHDLNISASYLIKKKVTVFVKANNILGSVEKLKWQRWNGYESMGFNMVFGLKMAF